MREYKAMMQPSEIIAAKLLPAIRARLAQILLSDYHMKQVEVAEHLGITQAAVSHYNTRSRAVDEEVFAVFPEIEDGVRDLAGRISEGLPKPEQIAAVEELCKNITRTERFCAYHRRYSRLDSQCQICFPPTERA
jgi:predicted transcriptional regulator